MNIRIKRKKPKAKKSTAVRLKELEARVKKVEAVAHAAFRHAVRADRAIELLYSAKAKKRAAKK